MMRKLLTLLALAASVLLRSCSGKPADPDVEAVRGLAERLVPDYSDRISFEKTADSTDVYEFETVGGRLVIRGNDALSMAVGLNRYLRDWCHTSVSWHASDPVQYPPEMPRVEGKVRATALKGERFFLNYCTFGYTMPWWQWEEWERLVDWMALNGVTMPLATSGQEALWLKVWTSHGMTEDEVRAYFTGPAHLPWHRMCNIDGVDGPLPESWTDVQAELQQKILAREREFGMTPVLPAFNGHVPARLKELYPEAEITDVIGWGGFDESYACHFLSPTDPLFAQIQKEYLEAQEELFGTDHIYGVDLFNEVEAPSWEPSVLAGMSSAVYSSLSAADPEAKWLQMGWMFHNDRRHWTPENIRAYLEAVPEGKVIILDYYLEHTPVWTLTDSFCGQPYILCYLGNFGGNTRISGCFRKTSERITEALGSGGDNLIGLGATLEGFGVNGFMFEYLFDRAWDTGVEDDEWISKLADRRLGRVDETNERLWRKFVDSCYVHGSISEGTLICGRPVLDGWWHWPVIHGPFYDREALVDVWKGLLEEHSDRDSYRFDVVNTGCQALGDLFALKRDAFAAAFREGNLPEAERLGAEMKEILADTDSLAAAEEQLRLDVWLSAAERFGRTAGEKAYYSKNARHIVTTWGWGKTLKDYASRQWSGLVKTYYAPRWEMFIDEVLSSMREGRTFDAVSLDERIDAFEESWVDGDVPIESVPAPSDWKAFAKSLRDKWFRSEPDVLD